MEIIPGVWGVKPKSGSKI